MEMGVLKLFLGRMKSFAIGAKNGHRNGNGSTNISLTYLIPVIPKLEASKNSSKHTSMISNDSKEFVAEPGSTTVNPRKN